MNWLLCLHLIAAASGLVSLSSPKLRQPAPLTKQLTTNNHSNSTLLTKKSNVSQDPNRHFTLYQPANGIATGSVILLAPWDGREGWWKEWLKSDWNTLTGGNLRVLEAVGQMYEHSDANYRGWYAYEDWHNEVPVMAEMLDAVRYVHSLIQQEFAIVGDYNRIAIAGYSQGAVLALEAGLAFPHPLGLVFSQRGVLLETRLDDPTPVAKSNVVFTAGAYDDVYKEEWVIHCCNQALEKGATSFMKSISGLDHYARSTRENELLMKSVAVAMTQSPPQSAQSIQAFGGWTPC